MALKPRHERFCQAYVLNGGNITQAMIEAGYSASYADARGHEMLGNVGIKERIAELQKTGEGKFEITRDRVLEELAKLAFLDVRKMFDKNGQPLPLTEFDDMTAGAIAGIEVLEQFDQEGAITGYIKKYRLADKKGAIDLICKIQGYYAPVQQEVKVKNDMNELSDDDLRRIAGGTGS